MDARLTVSNEQGLAHASAVLARGSALPPEGLPPPAILDSWARCVAAGLVPGAAMQVPVATSADLAQRRERAELVRRLAQAELETLSRQIAGSNFLLAFADSEGVILDLYADNRFAMSGANAGILAGSMWGEQVAGTNGLGTALASGGAIAVTGLEHYFLKLGDISCTATPVRDAFGQVVGVLDASSYYESRQRHTQALVQMAATHIENDLLAHQMRGHLVLALHPRAEYLGTLSAALLAFDEPGLLVAANANGRLMLSGLDLLPGARFEDLFGEPFERVLARFQVGHDVKLRDTLGSAVLARMLGQPRLTRHMPSRATALPDRSRAAATTTTTTTTIATAAAAAAAATAAEPERRFLSDDPAVAEACRQVQAALQLGVPVLLHGETGTGKELLARHAHAASGRQGQFVAVNCAALPAELFEAELFGYAPGAYTGARHQGSAGLLVAADGGTLLLDEIRELPLPLQAALLRFLDDRLVRPVGGRQSRRVDLQLLAASHADLDLAVREGQFRADLLYRLNTVCVTLPPLRRRDDFAPAVRWTLKLLAPQLSISDEAIAWLRCHPWPGNFRELRSVLTRAIVARHADLRGHALCTADVRAVLPPTIALPADTAASALVSKLKRSAGDLVRAEYERQGQSVSRAARALGVSRTTVYRHVRG